MFNLKISPRTAYVTETKPMHLEQRWPNVSRKKVEASPTGTKMRTVPLGRNLKSEHLGQKRD